MNETFWENVGVFIIIWTMLCMFYFIIYSYVDKKGKTKGFSSQEKNLTMGTDVKETL